MLIHILTTTWNSDLLLFLVTSLTASKQESNLNNQAVTDNSLVEVFCNNDGINTNKYRFFLQRSKASSTLHKLPKSHGRWNRSLDFAPQFFLHHGFHFVLLLWQSTLCVLFSISIICLSFKSFIYQFHYLHLELTLRYFTNTKRIEKRIF